VLKLTLLGILLVPLLLNAKSNTQTIGDALLLAIPLTAYGTTLYLDDKEGQTQLYKSFGSTLAITEALKYSVREKRPDTNEKDSFPSAHTSLTFSGATFIHKRYGVKYALVPYLGAIYTGYSRVHSHRHHTQDVLAGAILGMASSWYFTTRYKNIDIMPIGDTAYQGIQLAYTW